MVLPRVMPGEVAFVQSLNGHVMGPLTVETVEIVLNVSGRYDRYKFRVEPEKGYCGAYPVSEERVFRTREAAGG